MRRALDSELVRRGLADDRAGARAAIAAGRVLVDGAVASSSASLVAADQAVRVVEPRPARFVSRGGLKLDAALDRFELDVTGLDALDAGAATGGFTDCLLQRGAARVVAVDVGYGDLAWTLRTDPRVTVLERTNVRDLDPRALPFAPELVVADLSFTTLGAQIPFLVGLTPDGASFVVLVKPQFELPRSEVGPGGIVRDPRGWRVALERVATAFAAVGVRTEGIVRSPVRGRSGNVEFVLRGERDTDGDTGDAGRLIEEAIASVTEERAR